MMDSTQRLALLMAIAISSSSSPKIIASTTAQSRADALHTLEQFKRYDGRMAVALEFLQSERHVVHLDDGERIDITAAIKLFSLGILDSYLRNVFSNASESDRLTFRSSISMATHKLVQGAATIENDPVGNVIETENRMLGMKLAAILADIALREFPQRWPSFIDDLFTPSQNGGLWYSEDKLDRVGYGPMIGVKIALECLKLITEDCTDSDFNSKVSTSRRNDILTGLNEVRDKFLPLIFNLLSLQFAKLLEAKKMIHEIDQLICSSGRNVMQLASEEKALYNCQITRREAAGRLTTDCLLTIERFCLYMPIEWMTGTSNGCDYVRAFLHLLREETLNIQVLAASCLEQLSFRKLDYNQWIYFISNLPTAFGEANKFSDPKDLIVKLPFHRIISKAFASLISSHLAYVSTSKDLTKNCGPLLQVLSPFLHIMTEMLAHPSPMIAGEQLSAWLGLLREPVITKSQPTILQPFLERVLKAYITSAARIRWEDVEERTHPFSDLLEAIWSDKDEYETFLSETRSRSFQLFKLIGGAEPEIAVVTIERNLNHLLQNYGQLTGLTMQSESVVRLETIVPPFELILQGLPSWSLGDDKISWTSKPERSRAATRIIVKSTLRNIAQMILGWTPSDLCLQFRKVTMVEVLQYYWQHEPETLGTGVDTLLSYLNADVPSTKMEAMSTESANELLLNLRKKSAQALIAISKRVPHLLVSFLGPLCDRVKVLLSSNSLNPTNEMCLYEFLSCIATAIDDPFSRASFISNVLTHSLSYINSPSTIAALRDPESLLEFIGVKNVSRDPGLATNPSFIKDVTSQVMGMLSSFNQLLSVGKRCHEAAKKRSNGGLPISDECLLAEIPTGYCNFPDEGPVALNDLLSNDPFVTLWPHIFPRLIQGANALLGIWKRECQSVLLRDPLQRFALAVTDDELYLAKKQDLGDGGVFGRGGTAGSVVAGWDRRSNNIAPKWSFWLNELRTIIFHFLGLATSSRILYSPEIAIFYPQLVHIIGDRSNLLSMEHRHVTHYMKNFLEPLLLSCPSSLYQSHLTPILVPFFTHIQYRLQITWAPVFEQSPNMDRMKPLTTRNCHHAANVASSGEIPWVMEYYPRGGIFIGDAESVMGDEISEKVRVEMNRHFCDMLQTAFALKGDWALVLANQAKSEQSVRTLSRDNDEPLVNADGTPRTAVHLALDARKMLRIQIMCRYLLLDEIQVAEPLVLAIIDSLQYPDAYICRRCTKLCHRIIETVAWSDQYTDILGNRLFSILVRAIVTEPKWMIGIEWDLINLIRDIYCRIVLGQTLLSGGQGSGMEHPFDVVTGQFEQAKTVNNPLHGGGLLCKPSSLPRQILSSLPGITIEMVREMENSMTVKRSLKDQKDVLRDLLRLSAEKLKTSETQDNIFGMFSRATESESLLSQNARKPIVSDLPEKLITYTMLKRAEDIENKFEFESLDDFL